MRSRAHNGRDHHWEVERRIPVGTIVAIVLQTATLVWWSATLATRVEGIELKIKDIPSDRITKIETKLEYVTDGVKEIKGALDRLERRPIQSTRK